MGVYFFDEGLSMDLWFPPEGGVMENPKGRGQYVQPIRELPSAKRIAHLFVGINTKTMFSINVRISDTCEIIEQFPNAGVPYLSPSCRPTAWCVKHCYAKAGLMAFSAQQRTYFANTLYFHTASPERMAEDARKLVKKCRHYGIDNIRLSGGGDLSAGYVRFINIAAEQHPDFVFWGMTKRSDLIKKVKPRPNVIFQFSLDPTSPTSMPLHNPIPILEKDPCGPGRYSPVPLPIESFAPTAQARGWNFCYATHLASATDPKLQGLRMSGFPVMTIFGDHIGDSHFDTGDEFQCPCTHPWIVPFYQSLAEKTALPKQPGKKQRFKVTFPYYPEGAPRGPGGVPSICQTCRWCMTAPKDRARKLPWRTPMGSLQAFGESAGGRLWIWGKEKGRFLPNPDGDAQFWSEVRQDMASIDPWFYGM